MSEEIKIKAEPIDPEYDNVVARVKAEPEDIPDNFFDDIENNDFLNELVDNVDGDEIADVGSGTPAVADEVPPGEESAGSDELPLREQIEKLTKIIERRKKKLVGCLEANLSNRTPRSRSKSPRRPSKRRRSISRDRRRSRSKSHERRGSKSREVRRSLSRDRRSRRRSRSHDRVSRGSRRSRSRGRRSRSIENRRRHRSRSTGRKSGKKISFLEELEKIFAAKGQAFPEVKKSLSTREKEAILEEIRATSSNSSSDRYGSGNALATNIPRDYQDHNQILQEFQLPMPIQIKTEPADYDDRIGRDPSGMDAMEPSIKRVKVEQEEEETMEVRREKVIKMCMEAIEKLQISEENPLKTRFFYTPAVITRSGMDDSLENRSPLNQIFNVQFKFNSTNNNLDLEQWGLWKLSDTISNVMREIGYDVAQLVDKLSFKDIPAILKPDKDGKGVKKDGKTYSSFYTDSGTQTDEATCSTCIIRQLRKYVDKGVQEKPLVGEVAIQTEREDELPIMNTLAMLNSSQLIALNDFSEIIRSTAPTNAAELYRMREKLIDIYNLSQRPCMMPAKFSAPQAPGFNTHVANQSMSQYFDTGSQPCPPPMYAIQPQPNINQQFPFQPGASSGVMHPFQQNMSIQQPYPDPQPVPPPLRSIPLQVPLRRDDPRAHPLVMPRRDDPRNSRDRERGLISARDSNPPPPPMSATHRSGELNSISGRSYGRGSRR